MAFCPIGIDEQRGGPVRIFVIIGLFGVLVNLLGNGLYELLLAIYRKSKIDKVVAFRGRSIKWKCSIVVVLIVPTVAILAFFEDRSEKGSERGGGNKSSMKWLIQL